MAPYLEACYFGGNERAEAYRRLAEVLEYTAHKHCATWNVRVERLAPPPTRYMSAMGNASHIWNTYKLEHWVSRALAAPDGAQVLLIDGDMMIVRRLDDIWSREFDLAYTIRHGFHLPLNGGVVFLRMSEGVRSFLREWGEVNRRFLADKKEHQNWRRKYAGINQSSFGYMLEKVKHGLKLERLPCSEWNLCEWERGWDPKVIRVIHIKSSLRRAVFKIKPVPPRISPKLRALVTMWQKEEEEAKKWRRRQAEKSASTDTETTPSMSVDV